MSNTTHGEGVVRGVGYAVAYKNVGFSEGFDDYSTARVRLQVVGGEPVATVHTAAAEVGQGLVTVEAQIARTELGVDRVVVPPRTPTSAARLDLGVAADLRHRRRGQGRLRERSRLVPSGRDRGSARRRRPAVRARRRRGPTGSGVTLADLLGDEVVEATVEWRHRPTEPVDPETGQGFAHVQYAFAAHRAVVDVDVELGLVKVVELACAQDVGKAINPQAVLGQIHGGSAQGLGLALMEEIQVVDGVVRNPSFTDYLIPTILDMPPMPSRCSSTPTRTRPTACAGSARAPTISSGPAIVAAIRAATGLDLCRVPLRPEDVTGTR